MDKERKKTIVRAFQETFTTLDADAILARMTADPCWVFFNQQTFSGREGVLTILRAFSELYQPGSTRTEFVAQYVDGNTVISQSILRATTLKGEPYENHYVTFVHLVGNKVAKVEEYLDTAYANQKFAGWGLRPA